MKILFKNANVIFQGKKDVLVEDKNIRLVTTAGTVSEEGVDRVIDCKDKLLMPAFYNAHSHAAMTLFRGYGEDMPLDKWLTERIFPAEEQLGTTIVFYASELACAEMLRNGIVSFSDMYMFSERTIEAAIIAGMKANVSRCIVSSDPDEDMAKSTRFLEAKRIYDYCHGCDEGRIKVDVAVHAEYTNTENSLRFMADFAREHDLRMHVHVSETEKEHKECMERHEGRTPTEFLRDCGVFDVPTTAAHCVWVTDNDMDILREYGVTVAHCPASNLKLGSGIMRTSDMLRHGVRVAIGTDGSASNNCLDMFRETYLASLLDKGTTRNPAGHKAAEFIKMATRNGAFAQGRDDCGDIFSGKKADLILVDMNDVNTFHNFAPETALLYSANPGNVTLTMCDGRILYENGTYTFIDIEKLKFELRESSESFFKKIQ